MNLLEVKNLEKILGGKSVVNGLSFNVKKGEVVGLLGPNGAGKTTAFYMAIGLIAHAKSHSVPTRRRIRRCQTADSTCLRS